MAVIGLTFNLGKDEPPEDGEPPDSQAEYDTETTIFAVAEALRSADHQVELIEANEHALTRLSELKLDMVFNISEGLRGESRESHIPAVLEMLGIPYTGSRVLALALCLDKPAAKKILRYHGIPTPNFNVIDLDGPITVGALEFPLFVKPSHEGSSMGISPRSIIYNDTDFVRQVDYLRTTYRQPVLVEEFLEGREFTVGVIGNENLITLPITEINYDVCPPDHGKIYSHHFKREWSDDSYYLCPAPISNSEAEAISNCAISAYRVLGCLDIARVDIRLDNWGVPNVIEVNPLPGLRPGFSDLPRQAAAGGISYNELINGVLDCALIRNGLGHLASNLRFGEMPMTA